MKAFSYWSGPLTWMERLSIASIQATGHDLTIYSYEPDALRDVNCRIRDARELIDNRDLDDLRSRLPAFFSDNLRLEGLDQEAGTWLDLDIVMLKTLPDEPHLFGWEKPTQVCGAVLRFPRTCPAFKAYLAMCRDHPTSNEKLWEPWWNRMNTRRRNVVRKIRGKQPTAPKFGPAALTHFVTSSPDMAKLIKPAQVFYPVPPDRSFMEGIAKRGAIEGTIKPDTVCVHLWRSLYHSTHGQASPRSGWIREQMESLKVRELELA